MTTLPDPLARALCEIDGELVPLGEARISVLDRGFIFGDGVYEVIPVYGRRLFRLEDHLARLRRSLARVHISLPVGDQNWLPRLKRVIEAQDFDDQLLYLQVTRGVAPRMLAPPDGLAPTVFLMAMPMTGIPPAERHGGVACVTARDLRWEHGDIKSVSMLGNVLSRLTAAQAGAHETILLRDGAAGGPWLTEASSANVWIVHEGALLGPPRGEHLLEGVRAGLLKELCEELGIGYNRCPISEQELRAAEEVMLSSAAREVVAVTSLDGEPVGHGALRGKPGPVYARLYEAYQRAKLEQCV